MVVLDGSHRIHAAINAGEKTIVARTLIGISETDAMLIAMKANLAHGVPLTPEERQQACLNIIVAMTDKDGNQPANTVVAEAMGVSETTIRDYRQKLVAAVPLL